MAFLGVPYRIMYEAVNLQSGLMHVQAWVLRPGETVALGPFDLVELPAPFNGRYYYDYPNLVTDPQGDYFANIYSPGDGGNTTFRFELYIPFANSTSVEELLAAIDGLVIPQTPVQTNLIAYVNDSTSLAGVVGEDESLQGSIENSIPLIGQIDDNQAISGELNDLNPIIGEIED